jgi:gamma-glutamyltranspeptidase/glutathione hydrolase
MSANLTAGIATPLSSATSVGADIIRSGGTAVDAAIAANALLTVAFPHMCSVGGDLFAVVRDASGNSVSINGSGKSSILGGFAGEYVGEKDWLRGRHTVTVPGTVGAWAELHRRFGRLPLARLLEPAIEAARNGFSVGPSLARSLRLHKTFLKKDEGSRSTFFLDGVIAVEGQRIKQPALAETLEAIAKDQRTFYTGEVSRKLLDGLRKLEVPMSETDFSGYTPVVEATLSREVQVGERTFRIHTSPPNSQGLLLISALQDIHRSTDDPSPSNPQTARAMARAAAKAARWRNDCLADPSRMTLNSTALLDSDMEESGAAPYLEKSGSGDTVAVVVSDGEGVSISLIQSLYSAFGTGETDPATGVILQNRGACFSQSSSSVNALAPGVRPSHSLMPVLVELDGNLNLVAGTMGGLGQPQVHAQLILRILGINESLESAIKAARWILDPPPIHGEAWLFAAEPDVSAEVIEILEQEGFEHRPALKNEDTFGHAQVIRIEGLELSAASDPRADGTACVLEPSPFAVSENASQYNHDREID